MSRIHYTAAAAAALVLAFILSGCETVKTTESGAVGVERSQQMVVPASELDAAARTQYTSLLATERRNRTLNASPAQLERVRTIANRLIAQTAVFRADARTWDWQVNVLSTPDINAWCMPGGKIAVHTGLIDKLNATDDELAAVLGHEIAHALREHARERASEQMVASGAISVGSALLGVGSLGQQGARYAYMGLLGLPNSRTHETEADRMGIELAARAGYDPRAAIALWQKMARSGGKEPSKFFSTHPPHAERISDLEIYSQRVLPLYKQSATR